MRPRLGNGACIMWRGASKCAGRVPVVPDLAVMHFLRVDGAGPLAAA